MLLLLVWGLGQETWASDTISGSSGLCFHKEGRAGKYGLVPGLLSKYLMRCVCLPFASTPEAPHSDVDPPQSQTLSNRVNESAVPGHYDLRLVKNVSSIFPNYIYIYTHTETCIHIHTYAYISM